MSGWPFIIRVGIDPVALGALVQRSTDGGGRSLLTYVLYPVNKPGARSPAPLGERRATGEEEERSAFVCRGHTGSRTDRRTREADTLTGKLTGKGDRQTGRQ